MLLHQRANHEDQKFKRHRKSISVSSPLSVKQAIKSHLLSQNIEPFKYQAGVFFSPLPLPPFPSFTLVPTVRVTISTLPNLPLS